MTCNVSSGTLNSTIPLDIRSAVIVCLLLSFCPRTDISAGVRPIGVKVCVMLDLSSGQVLSPFGGNVFRGHQMRDQTRERGQFWGP